MLEWDILNYLKKWRTNLRATDMNTQESEWIGEELDWAGKMLSKISLL